MKPKLEVSVNELERAWLRVNADHKKYRFADHPHLLDWIEADLPGWLDTLRVELKEGYTPRPGQVCWVPKPGGPLRPALLLSIEDEVVYSLLVEKLYPSVYSQLKDLQGTPDASYPMVETAESPEWFTNSFRAWSRFQGASRGLLSDGHSYMLSTDITGFYDNINLRLLISDLRKLSGDSAELQLLTKCLNVWAEERGKGIPQAYSASHLLAKLYLEPVDRAMANEGLVHLRYVDDFRVFVESLRDGRKAVQRITALLHQRSLSIQGTKTKVRDKSEALRLVDGVTPVIDDLSQKLRREVIATHGLDTAYLTVAEIDAYLSDRAGPPPAVLERAFNERFSRAGDKEFNKTLFRYLLSRLGRAGSAVAVDYCIATLYSHPEETEFILKYFGQLKETGDAVAGVVEFLGSKDAHYEYQCYQIVRWFVAVKISDAGVLALCRQWALDRNRDPWLRSYAVAYLGAFGAGSDLESLLAEIPRAASDLERADLVAGIARLEESRRNTVYGRLRPTDSLASRAASLAKAHTKPHTKPI